MNTSRPDAKARDTAAEWNLLAGEAHRGSPVVSTQVGLFATMRRTAGRYKKREPPGFRLPVCRSHDREDDGSYCSS